MQFIIFILLYLLVIPAIILSTSFLLRFEKDNYSTELSYGGFVIIFLFLLYVFSIVLYLFNLLAVPYVILCSILIILLLYKIEWKRSLNYIGDIFNELKLALISSPPLLFTLCMVIFFYLSSPIQEGDSLSYHLSNVWNMISAQIYNPSSMYDPTATTNYYQKGMETIYALFYLFPLPRVSIFLLKLTFFIPFYFLIKDATSNRFFSGIIIAIFLSCEIIVNDIASIKNDLPLGVLITYSTYLLLKHRNRLPFISLMSAFSLSLAIKTNAIFYLGTLFPLWLVRERQNLVRFILCIFIVIVFGGFFFIENIFYKGSPLYPYGVSFLTYKIFSGLSPDFGGTTIFANFDRRTIPVFIRGALCAFGPLGLGTIIVSGVIEIFYGIKKLIQKKWSYENIITLVIILLFAIAYIITPFSDRNCAEKHNMLFSGNNIRFAFPLIFLIVVLFPREFFVFVNRIKIKYPLSSVAMAFLLIIFWINLSWINIFFLTVKPYTAFSNIAPVIKSFNNLTLGIIYLFISFFIGIFSIRKWKFLLPLILISSVIVYQLNYPESLSYSRRFKPMGVKTSVFSFLKNYDLKNKSIGLHCSIPNSSFICAMNDFILRPEKKVRYSPTIERLKGDDVIIVCASDTIIAVSFLRGRIYRPTISFFNEEKLFPLYRKIFADEGYIVYEQYDNKNN